MRVSCIDCVRKHIGQASVLMDEAKLGYPHHRWFAVGHLAEAESESIADYPLFAGKIRTARINIMNGYDHNFDELLIEANGLAGESNKYDVNNSKEFDGVTTSKRTVILC